MCYILRFLDPKTLLNEEIVKQMCKRYFQTGACQFFGHCKYTHYTQEELWQFKTEGKMVVNYKLSVVY